VEVRYDAFGALQTFTFYRLRGQVMFASWREVFPMRALFLLLIVIAAGFALSSQFAADHTPRKTGAGQVAHHDEEEPTIAGLPRGASRPLPPGTTWNVDDLVTAKSSARERIDLAGPWRFAVLEERDAILRRWEMGWVVMPTNAPRGAFSRLDPSGKPLLAGEAVQAPDDNDWLIVEHDIESRSDWLTRRVFFDIRGPWADAEVYVIGADIYTSKAARVDYRGGSRFDLGELLAYPGTNRLVLRIRVADWKKTAECVPADSSYVGLEVLPSGPRFEHITAAVAPSGEQLVVTFDLWRPRTMLLPGARLRELPIEIRLQVDDPETSQVVLKHNESIGPLPQQTRRVTWRLPWPTTASSGAPERSLRLRAILVRGDADGGGFDDAFALTITPAKANR